MAPGGHDAGPDYGFADPADGPAFLVMSGVGIAVAAIWARTVVAFQPPLWLRFGLDPRVSAYAFSGTLAVGRT